MFPLKCQVIMQQACTRMQPFNSLAQHLLLLTLAASPRPGRAPSCRAIFPSVCSRLTFSEWKTAGGGSFLRRLSMESARKTAAVTTTHRRKLEGRPTEWVLTRLSGARVKRRPVYCRPSYQQPKTRPFV